MYVKKCFAHGGLMLQKGSKKQTVFGFFQTANLLKNRMVIATKIDVKNEFAGNFFCLREIQFKKNRKRLF